jgi:hypothetical protein
MAFDKNFWSKSKKVSRTAVEVAPEPRGSGPAAPPANDYPRSVENPNGALELGQTEEVVPGHGPFPADAFSRSALQLPSREAGSFRLG